MAKVLLLRRLEAPLADPQLVRFASRGRGAADLPLLPAGDVPQGGPGHLPGVLRGLLADEPLTSGEAPRARLRLAVHAALVERVPRVQGPGLGRGPPAGIGASPFAPPAPGCPALGET